MQEQTREPGTRNAKLHWKRPVAWTRMLVQLDTLFEGRLPA